MLCLFLISLGGGTGASLYVVICTEKHSTRNERTRVGGEAEKKMYNGSCVIAQQGSVTGQYLWIVVRLCSPI